MTHELNIDRPKADLANRALKKASKRLAAAAPPPSPLLSSGEISLVSGLSLLAFEASSGNRARFTQCSSGVRASSDPIPIAFCLSGRNRFPPTSLPTRWKSRENDPTLWIPKGEDLSFHLLPFFVSTKSARLREDTISLGRLVD